MFHAKFQHCEQSNYVVILQKVGPRFCCRGQYYKKVLLTANTNVNGKSKSYASKQTVIEESALTLKHLELSFNRGGFEGLRVLLSELNSMG